MDRRTRLPRFRARLRHALPRCLCVDLAAAISFRPTPGSSERGQDPRMGLRREHAHRFANVDKCCYDAARDLLLMGTYLKDRGDHTATPAYDCENNRWITLDIKYRTGKRSGSTTRAFPHRRSDGLMFDPQRKIIWGTDTNSQVYVLRLDLEHAAAKPLN